MTDTIENCASCKYAMDIENKQSLLGVTKNKSEFPVDIKQCRFNAPISFPLYDKKGKPEYSVTTQPTVVRSEYWCGQFKRK